MERITDHFPRQQQIVIDSAVVLFESPKFHKWMTVTKNCHIGDGVSLKVELKSVQLLNDQRVSQPITVRVDCIVASMTE